MTVLITVFLLYWSFFMKKEILYISFILYIYIIYNFINGEDFFDFNWLTLIFSFAFCYQTYYFVFLYETKAESIVKRI